MISLPLFPSIDDIEPMADEAIDFLRSGLSGKNEVFVAFSGGKDSIVTADLVRRSGLPYRLFYSFTGIDPPELIRFIRRYYPGCVFLKPKKTFWQDLAKNVPPSDRLRWCCTAIKKMPSWRLGHSFRALGIRSEESYRRGKYPRINHFKNKWTDHFQFYPIFHWNTSHVWDYIQDRGLSYPSLYDEGWDRIGCVICPFHSESTGNLHRIYRNRWPKFFDCFERTIEKLYWLRVSQGRKMAYPSPQDFLDAWYRYKNARWYAPDSNSNIETEQLRIYA